MFNEPKSDADSQELNPYSAPTYFDPIKAFGSRETLVRVAHGLNLVYWGIGLVFLSLILGGTLLLTLGQPLVAAAVLLCMIAGYIMGLVGRIMCLAVPDETGAKPMIFGAVLCDVLGLIITMTVAVMTIENGEQALQLAGNVINLTASVLFILFLKRVAVFIREEEIAMRAQSLITLGVAAIAAVVVGGVLASMQINAVLFLMFALMVLFLFMLLRYVRLLSDLRLAILRPAA